MEKLTVSADMTDIADDLKLMGDKTRLQMLSLLQDREWCVCEFVDIFDISQPAVSQHLRRLRSKGIVKEQKRGQWVYYSLNIEDKPHIQAILKFTLDSYDILEMLNKSEVTACCD